MEFKILNINDNRAISTECQEGADGILYLTVKLVQNENSAPEPFTIKWKIPSNDCYSTWNPNVTPARNLCANWNRRKTQSRLAMWMPVHTVVSLRGKNKITIAVSDAVTPMTIATGVCEEDACIDCSVEFFTFPVAPLKEYSATIRIDMRNIQYYDSIYDVASWWENQCDYKPTSVPEFAKLPMNSLWYSYHQNLDTEDIIRECKLSKALGMDTVIIDDGWQTDDNSRGYAFCGDWEVAQSKIPDMREFVEKIHQTGMKVMMWYAVPFLGIHTKNYEKYKDMLLDNTGNNKNFWAMDPRYREVREFLIENYKNALLNWDVDGLKLDFIDLFVLSGKSFEYDERRDYQSLEDAIDALMSETTKALKEIKSDVLIEFRQPYVGPAVRKYGNMLRVGDCPNDAILNRVNIVDLRLTSGDTAVHSDMLMWNYDDSVESAAIQFANALYAVPQISMKIQHLNDEHKKMLSFYLNFWRENVDILLNGKISAKNPEACYSIVCAKKDDKAIYTAYTDNIIESNGEKEIIAVNVTEKDEFILRGMSTRRYKVLNCMGEEVTKGTLSADVEVVDVPLCGMVFVN